MGAIKNKIGSIYYDKRDKRFRCIYYVIDNETKVETRKTKAFLSEEEAKKFLTSIQCQKGNELFIKNNGIPLNELMRATAKRKLEMNMIKERQYKRIIETITNIEKSSISKQNIENISSEEIQNYLNTLTNYSDSTIKKIYEQFTQNFKIAMNKGYITKNPLIDVIRPKSNKPTKVVRALELEEQQAFTNYLTSVSIAQEPFKNVFLLQMYLGLRIGEALALRNTDINLKKNIISISRTLTMDKDYRIIMGDTTKTYCGERQIPIPHFIRDSLISQMQLAENHKDKQLFINEKGGYMDPRNANRIMKSILHKMGIENVSTHSLRHTYGTRCIEAGMRAVALQRLMGHKNISITLDTYTSVFNKYKESELEKLNNYYINNAMFINNDLKMLDNIKTEEPEIM